MTSGFLALLDDIALLMDDVLILSKVATKKLRVFLPMTSLLMRIKLQDLHQAENSLYFGKYPKGRF